MSTYKWFLIVLGVLFVSPLLVLSSRLTFYYLEILKHTDSWQDLFLF